MALDGSLVINLLRQNITGAMLLQLGADLFCLFLAVLLATATEVSKLWANPQSPRGHALCPRSK